MNLVIKILPLLLLILLSACLNGINFNTHGVILLVIIPLTSYLLAFYLRILPTSLKIRPSFIIYCFWLVKEIFKSTFDVLKIIWSRNMNLSETMEWLSASDNDETLMTIYGNSITLTPGTVTLDIKNDMLLIHSLKKSSFADLEKGEMENKIKKVLLTSPTPLNRD